MKSVVPYLSLPPGYRFQIADGYEDVWFDLTLLGSLVESTVGSSHSAEAAFDQKQSLSLRENLRILLCLCAARLANSSCKKRP